MISRRLPAAAGAALALAGAAVAGEVQVAFGEASTLLLKADGSLMGTGSNSRGELLMPVGEFRRVFAPLPPTGNGLQVASKGGVTIVRRADGTLWSMGQGAIGRSYSEDFRQIGSATWSDVTLGGGHGAGVQADGSLWTWGRDSVVTGHSGYFTQLATRLGNLSTWRAVSAGAAFTLARRADGTLWSWGYNSSGQLGDGTLVDRTSPVQIGTSVNWGSFAAGGSHALALRTNGTLWAWGRNAAGQVGDGSRADKAAPVKITAGVSYISIAAGGSHSLAVADNGTLWAWGSNESGQLGLGDTTDRLVPTRVGNRSDWARVDAGDYQSAAVTRSGQLFLWGGNAFLNLGFHGTQARLSPVAAELNLPDILVSSEYPGLLKYPVAVEGGASSQKLTVRNIGAAPLTLQPLVLPPGFSSSTALPSTLAAGGQVIVPITFDATLPGRHEGNLTIRSNDPDEPVILYPYSAALISSAKDSDGDGLNDLAEYRMYELGFDWEVANADRVEKFLDGLRRAGFMNREQLGNAFPGMVEVDLSFRSNVEVRLEESPDLGGFSARALTGTTLDASGLLSVPLPPAEGRRFFRFAIETSPAAP